MINNDNFIVSRKKNKIVYFSVFVNYLCISCENHLRIRWKLQLRRVQCSFPKGYNVDSRWNNTYTRILCTVTIAMPKPWRYRSIGPSHSWCFLKSTVTANFSTIWRFALTLFFACQFKHIYRAQRAKYTREIHVYNGMSALWFLHQFNSD